VAVGDPRGASVGRFVKQARGETREQVAVAAAAPEGVHVARGSCPGRTTDAVEPVAGRPRYMGRRVAHANDLGELLSRTAPRPPPDRYALIEDAAARAAARAEGSSTDHDVLTRQPATDLQKRIAAANRELRRLGHPADRP
jgi:hypothetical protein